MEYLGEQVNIKQDDTKYHQHPNWFKKYKYDLEGSNNNKYELYTVRVVGAFYHSPSPYPFCLAFKGWISDMILYDTTI